MSDKKYYRYQDYFKSFLGGWSFEDGDRTLTIKSVREEEVFDPKTQKKKSALAVRFAEMELPMILNVTNAKAIAKVTGTDVMQDWIGRKVIAGSSKVNAFGDVHDVIRVRDRKPDEAVYKCEGCGNVITAYSGKEPSELVAISRRNTGKALCVPCQKKFKAEMAAQEEAGTKDTKNDA